MGHQMDTDGVQMIHMVTRWITRWSLLASQPTRDGSPGQHTALQPRKFRSTLRRILRDRENLVYRKLGGCTTMPCTKVVRLGGMEAPLIWLPPKMPAVGELYPFNLLFPSSAGPAHNPVLRQDASALHFPIRLNHRIRPQLCPHFSSPSPPTPTSCPPLGSPSSSATRNLQCL